MNNITRLSAAVALGMTLMGASLAAEAASAVSNTAQAQSAGVSYPRGKVIQLGTIVVTRADMEGAQAPKAKTHYGSTVYLGKIEVTAADTPEAHAAALAARASGAVFLGSVVVTPADSTDARYAVSVAQQPGTVYLGVVKVRAQNHKLPVIGTVLAAIDSVGSRNLLSVVGALVFGRTPG